MTETPPSSTLTIDFKDFSSCLQALQKLGAEVIRHDRMGPGGEEIEENRIYGVQIPLSPEEWMSLVMAEGRYYVGGCCAQSSATQDLVLYLFRFESGFAKMDTLSEIARQCIRHDGEEHSKFHEFSGLESFLAQPRGSRDPWDVLAAVWVLSKNHFVPKTPEALGPRYTPMEKAIQAVERSLRTLSWGHLFQSSRSEFQRKTDRTLTLLQLVPAMRFILSHLDRLDEGPVTGFAITDRKIGPNAIAFATSGGLLILPTQEEAFRVLEEAQKKYDEAKETIVLDFHSLSRFGFRPVSVSREDGIRFLDTNEPYVFEDAPSEEAIEEG